jgi:hypothetical protein
MPESINLKVSPQMMDYIFQVLQQRPWAEANPVIQELLKQAKNQGEVNGSDASTAG